jgi:hypothetical protein
MVVAAGDHRDDTSGVTAALDPVDERHEGNGHDPLPVPVETGRTHASTGALPAIPGEQQLALEPGAEDAAPTGDGDDRQERPLAIPPPPPPPGHDTRPVALTPVPAAPPPAVAVRPAAPEPVAPAPTVHPLIAGDPLLTGSTPVVRATEPKTQVAPDTPELLRPFDQATDDTGPPTKRRWWRGRTSSGPDDSEPIALPAGEPTQPMPLPAGEPTQPMPLPATEDATGPVASGALTPGPPPLLEPRPSPPGAAPVVAGAAAAATLAGASVAAGPSATATTAPTEARTARRGERDPSGATVRPAPTGPQQPAEPVPVVTSPTRPTAVAAAPQFAGRRPRVRRVTRVVRSVDPWSVFKVGAVFSAIAYGITLVAGVLLWNVAYATGTIDNIERGMESTGWDSFELNGGKIFHNLWIGGLFVAVGLTGALVLIATLFNLITDLVGGLRFTVLEEEVIERTPSMRRYASRREPSRPA